MRKLLAFLFVSLLLVLPVSAKVDDWAPVIKKTNSAVFYIETVSEDETGGCTGFVINVKEKLAMTANHCDPGAKGSIWADRVRAEVVAKDTKKDLLVIRMRELDPTREALPLADKNPSVGQDVMSVGFGYALDAIQFRKAAVSSSNLSIPEEGIGGPLIATNLAFTPGQSGGPVVDINGRVVAIVQRGDGGTLGLGVGAETIRERLGRFFESR